MATESNRNRKHRASMSFACKASGVLTSPYPGLDTSFGKLVRFR